MPCLPRSDGLERWTLPGLLTFLYCPLLLPGLGRDARRLWQGGHVARALMPSH